MVLFCVKLAKISQIYQDVFYGGHLKMIFSYFKIIRFISGIVDYL